MWDQVAGRLRSNNQSHRSGKSKSSPSLLSGRVFDTNGIRFTPTHTVKDGKRYRYYTSQAVINHSGSKPMLNRVPAQELEQIVRSQVHSLLSDPAKWTSGIEDVSRRETALERARELARTWPKIDADEQDKFVRKVLTRIVLGGTTAAIEIDHVNLIATLLGDKPEVRRDLRARKPNVLKLACAFETLRRGGQIQLSTPAVDSGDRQPTTSLVKAMARARVWYEQIVNGEISTVCDLALKWKLPRRYVRRILNCAILSPKITEAFLTGRHRSNLTLNETLKSVSHDWRKQEERILR